MKVENVFASDTQGVQAILDEVNGDATGHTYADAAALVGMLQHVEDHLCAILPAVQAIGIKYETVSGSKMPATYRGTRVATRLVFEFLGARRWQLIEAEKVKLNTPAAGRMFFKFTPRHDANAVAKLRKNYVIEEEGR